MLHPDVDDGRFLRPANVPLRMEVLEQLPVIRTARFGVSANQLLAEVPGLIELWLFRPRSRPPQVFYFAPGRGEVELHQIPSAVYQQLVTQVVFRALGVAAEGGDDIDLGGGWHLTRVGTPRSLGGSHVG